MPPADPSTAGRLTSSAYVLSIRQQPERAKIATGGKEKDRKAIDPPPMVQLRVKDPQDPAQNYLQSPYYFVACNLWDASEDRPADKGDTVDTPLVGSLVSSLHRLKDMDNQDGGFFVFGDISVKIEGSFRLKFTLFEILSGQVVSLQTIISNEFTVYNAKNFPGMSESTFISRSFGDQGVRIRIRKENRKRPASRDNTDSGSYVARQDPTTLQSLGYSPTAYGQPVGREYRYEDPNKRQRSSISHTGQIYDHPRQDWAYSQATSTTIPYPTHSAVTSGAYHGATASVADFSYRPHATDANTIQSTYGAQSPYDSRYTVHDTSRAYADSSNGQIAQPSATRAGNAAEQLQYQELSHYHPSSATGSSHQRDLSGSYHSQDSKFSTTSATLPPLSGAGGQTLSSVPYQAYPASYTSSTPVTGTTRGYPAPAYTAQALTHATYQS